MDGLVILTQHEALTDMSKYFLWTGLAFAFCVIIAIVVFTILDEKIHWHYYAILAVAVISIAVGVILPRETVIMAYAPNQAAVEAAMDQYHVKSIDGMLLTMGINPNK